MIPDHCQYQRYLAHRVFDALGSSGFNVSEDGRLGYFGPGGPWYAKDGDWIVRDPDGALSVRPGIPLERMTTDERFRLLYPGPPESDTEFSTYTEQELLDLVFPPKPPSDEAWLWQNPTAMKLVQQGLKDSAKDKLVKRGGFAPRRKG